MTVVLLHPLPLDGSVWDEVRATLQYETFAPTLYGMGESMGAWASSILDVAPPGPLVLVGNSIGGSCALEVARLAPERVCLLVLIGAKPGHRPEPDVRDEAVQLLEQNGLDAAWASYWAPLFAADADCDVVRRAHEVARAQGIDEIVRGVRVFHERPDRSEFIETFDAPVIVAHGELDRVPRDPARLARRLQRGKHVIVACSGHYVPLERPSELANVLRHAIDDLNNYP